MVEIEMWENVNKLFYIVWCGWVVVSCDWFLFFCGGNIKVVDCL